MRPSSPVSDERNPIGNEILAGTTGDNEPAFKDDVCEVTDDGSVIWTNFGKQKAIRLIQLDPIQSFIRKYFDLQYSKIPYPIYAIGHFGFRLGMKRIWQFWQFRLSPMLIVEWMQRKYRTFKLIDRRTKTGYTKTVYAVDRDGDLYLVECPQCHATQHIVFNWNYDAKTPYTTVLPPKVFQCFSCSIGFRVYLEDGLRKIIDHRDGTPPLPSKVVWDDSGKIHLGISNDAPWWWRRREIFRDIQYVAMKGVMVPVDGHAHHPYEIIEMENHSISEVCGNERSDTPQKDGGDGA